MRASEVACRVAHAARPFSSAAPIQVAGDAQPYIHHGASSEGTPLGMFKQLRGGMPKLTPGVVHLRLRAAKPPRRLRLAAFTAPAAESTFTSTQERWKWSQERRAAPGPARRRSRRRGRGPPGARRGCLRDIGGAPRNPAPRSHFFGAGCQITRLPLHGCIWWKRTIVECPPTPSLSLIAFPFSGCLSFSLFRSSSFSDCRRWPGRRSAAPSPRGPRCRSPRPPPRRPCTTLRRSPRAPRARGW